jgi:hypothetical protein
VEAFRSVPREWRITLNQGVLEKLQEINPKVPVRDEVTNFLDLVRVRNWEELEKRTRYFNISVWCFAAELVLRVVGLLIASESLVGTERLREGF